MGIMYIKIYSSKLFIVSFFFYIGDIEVVKILLNEIRHIDSNDKSALNYALISKNRNEEIIKMVLESQNIIF